MASKHVQTCSVTPSPQRQRPPNSRHSSGRSTLRSAEEQLRDIREGDTSWQLDSLSRSRTLTASEPVLPNGNASDDKVGDTSELVVDRVETVRVYLHHVRKTDTLPLILLAYEISATVLKKANRLWATDSIQNRRKLYLPIAECGVKAELCLPPQSNQPSYDRVRDVTMGTATHGDHGEWPPRLKEQPPEEDSGEWVLIPGIGLTQIISLPAHKLSYFPTTRRNTMERSTSMPSLDSLVVEDRCVRDSMDSVASRSSIGSLVEDGVGRVVRFWHDNQGRKKWAKIGSDLIEM